MESANVVGYVSTANIQAGKFYLIAQHFQDTTGGSVDLQNFITSSDMQGGTDDTDSPNLKLWAGSHYDDYFFYAEDMLGEQNVWGQDQFMSENVMVTLGDGAFLKTINDCSISIAGQVASADSMNVPLNSGTFNLIANPYPMALDLNGSKVGWADAIVGGTDDSDSPNIKVWSGSSYVDYYYYEEDMLGEEKCWGQDQFKSDDAVVEVGKGFWLKYSTPATGVNLTFNK